MSERSSVRKVVAASLVGTSLEWYDFFLYGSAAALVFNRLFFPTFDPLTGTLLAFTTFAVGFVARPIGGIIFGHYGDKVGRKKVLVVTLLLMGVATFLVGLLPTYDTIGVAAPLLLVTLRFVQGLGLGGEWGGAVLMALEHGNDERRGLHAAWPQVGVPAGNLLAAAVLGLLAWLLPDASFDAWGWRIPFLLSAALIVVGLWIRLVIAESPLFADVERTHTRARAPILDVLRVYPREVLVAIGARLGVDVAFYTFALFILTYATTQAGVPRSVALAAVLTGSAVQLVLIPWFGALSDRVGRRPVYSAGAIGALVWVWAFPAARHRASTAGAARRDRRARGARRDVRPAGRVHRRAVQHPAALQRRVARVPARRRARPHHLGGAAQPLRRLAGGGGVRRRRPARHPRRARRGARDRARPAHRREARGAGDPGRSGGVSGRCRRDRSSTSTPIWVSRTARGASGTTRRC